MQEYQEGTTRLLFIFRCQTPSLEILSITSPRNEGGGCYWIFHSMFVVRHICSWTNSSCFTLLAVHAMSAKPSEGDHNLEERKRCVVQQSEPRPPYDSEECRKVKLAKVPRNSCPARKRVKVLNNENGAHATTTLATTEEKQSFTKPVSSSVEMAKVDKNWHFSHHSCAAVWFIIFAQASSDALFTHSSKFAQAKTVCALFKLSTPKIELLTYLMPFCSYYVLSHPKQNPMRQRLHPKRNHHPRKR